MNKKNSMLCIRIDDELLEQLDRFAEAEQARDRSVRIGRAAAVRRLLDRGLRDVLVATGRGEAA